MCDCNYFEIAKVGEKAPLFEIDAVMPEGNGLERFGKVSLEENMKNGKWTVLYFYPLDFTFVWPTEIKKFGELYKGFEKLNAELIACSTDSVFSHLAWQDAGLGHLNHPHASDKNLAVSEMYGVLDEEKGLSWRGTFIINPEGILKWSSVYHGEVGRNVKEVLRTLQAYQNEEKGELVPCEWAPGNDFIKVK